MTLWRKATVMLTDGWRHTGESVTLPKTLTFIPVQK